MENRIYWTISTILLAGVLFLNIACEPDDTIVTKDVGITGFDPSAALGNDTIIIEGFGFDSNPILNVIEFSGAAKLADVISSTETELQVVVPTDAVAGEVKIAIGVNSSVSTVPFLLSPSISSVNPDGGLPGDQIIIQGQNFTTNLDRLVVFVGDTEIDSIFGGSSSQVVFPLPSGLPVGVTTVKVGTRLSEDEVVFAPEVPFNVFDPERPTITDILPRVATPGTPIRIFGNAFKDDPDSIFVTIGGIVVDEFIELDDDELIIVVPESIDVTGLGQLVVQITVSVLNQDGETLTSDPVDFTVVEPSDFLVYYTALNVPGGSNTQKQDDSIYVAEPVVNGSPIITRIAQRGVVAGIDDDPVNDLLYYQAGATVYQSDLDGSNEVIMNLGQGEGISDVVVDPSTSMAYYPSRIDDFIYALDLNTQLTTELTTLEDFGSKPVENIKLYDNILYYTEGKVLRSYDLATDVKTDLFTYTGSNFLISVAVSEDHVYVTEGITQPSIPSNINGNSKVYVGNRDGSGNLTELYDRPNENITDIEISDDFQTLFWMISDSSPARTGSIVSAPVTGDESQISTIVSGIRTGRCFTIVKKK